MNSMDEMAELVINSDLVKRQVREKKEEKRAHVTPLRKRWRQSYEKRNPLKVAARRAVLSAIKRGVLVKPDICDINNGECRGPVQAHHWHGYGIDHRLDVQWLCSKHHREADKG